MFRERRSRTIKKMAGHRTLRCTKIPRRCASKSLRLAGETWDLGLNSLKSGNISVLLAGQNILMSSTKTGRSLRNLDPLTDLTIVSRSCSDRGEASCEFHVHRAIYELARCTGGSILHCHPPCSIAASRIFKRAISTRV